MTRNDLGKELDVSPYDVDDWLLLGCPARKIRRAWEFEIEAVKSWLRRQKITLKKMNHRKFPSKPAFDQRWFGGRCPICADRGFPGEKAGRLYNFGEILEEKWCLRRVGIPCGHSLEVSIPSATTRMIDSPKH